MLKRSSPDKKMREKRAAHLQQILQEQPRLQAVSSHHMCNPLPEMADVHFEPVYFLRHPIERIVSVYTFERRQDSDSRGARAAKEKNFNEYVQWRMQPDVPRTIRDYQTSNIAGLHDVNPKKPMDDTALQLAVQRLQSSRCVGLVERYDESMVVFEEALRQHFEQIDLAYLVQNARRRLPGRRNPSRRDPNRALMDAVKQLGKQLPLALANNSYDLALHRLANQKLDAAIAALPDFEARLDDFRHRCRGLRKA